MPEKRLQDRVAVVTGASRGIGRAVALALAAEGAAVVVAAKSTAPRESLPGSIHTLAREIEAAGGRALPVKTDVRKVARHRRHGRIDEDFLRERGWTVFRGAVTYRMITKRPRQVVPPWTTAYR
jgi:NAD(P)-dependent dehydrogenase (short-subunit alcohol dehydrogenase family)